MFDILSVIPGRKKKTQSGWYSFNAVCCAYRGHRPDKRSRGGIMIEGNNWSFHCFNCGYKCGFTLGKSIGKSTKQFLQWCGIDEQQVQRWSLESLQKKDLLDIIREQKKKEITSKHFKSMQLPEGELLDVQNPNHKKFVDYLKQRCVNPNSYPFMITPHETGRNKNRIIIPFTFKNKIVGNTSRFLDDRTPKYLNEMQSGYVFNMDIQKSDWEICLVTEGIFDALSIDGVALMHNEINDQQAAMLSMLNRRIIVVPDQDTAGLKLCDRALDLGYSVSLPNWGPGVKDVNDAVVKYGKLATLLSILQCATSNKVKISLQRKKIEHRV